MRHVDLSPDQRSVALTLAQRALSMARGLSTARPGYVYIPNGDGTGTWIGGEVGSGGVAEWIGDTTPPGRPTGCSCSSAWGTVYAKWDGTLEGGVPADLAYVEVTAGDAVLGRLSEAGTVAADGFDDGQRLDVTFVAWDGAKARDGSPAPNASGPTVVQVTVSDERDAIDEAVQEANDKADALQQEVTDVKATVGGVEQDVSELTTQVSGAVERADQSLSVATEAKQTADAISDTAERAYEDAQSALTQASSAVQTATQLQQTVEEDYLSKDEATGTYASKSDVTQTASDILSTVESEYQSKDGMGSYYTKTEVDQRDDAITTTVSEAVETADGAMEKATTVEQTVDGLEVTVADAASRADAAQQAASDAEKVATNYLSFSSAGLVVGDQTAGALGGNTLVRSNGVAIRQGATELATFGASSVELGKNSTSSAIALCGGKLRLSYERIEVQGTPSMGVVRCPDGLVLTKSAVGAAGSAMTTVTLDELIEMSDKVDDYLTPRSGRLSLGSGVTNYDSSYPAAWVKIGGWVHLRGRVVTNRGDAVVWTIPADLILAEDVPPSGVNRNFLCFAQTVTGSYYNNTYINSSRQVVSSNQCRLLDLSAISFRAPYGGM